MLPATAYASNEGELEGTTGQMEGTTGEMEDTTENETSVTETTEELTVEEELLSITAMELSCPGYVAGGSIADAVPTTATDGITISAYEWQDDSKTALTDGTFAADTQYRLQVFLKVEEGYTADSLEEANVKIDGEEAAYFTNPCTGEDALKGDMEIIHEPAKLAAPQTARYIVSFNANGGTGTMEDVTNVSDEYTLPENGFTAPDGRRFKGWATGADEMVISGTTIDITDDTTLYAIWEQVTYVEGEITYPDAENVRIDGAFFYNDKLYYTNGAKTGSLAENPNWNAHYDPTTGILELRGYDGGRITATYATNFTVKLIGENTITITSDISGSALCFDRDLTITSDCDGSLIIKNICDSNFVSGIASDYSNVTIDGSAYLWMELRTTAENKPALGIQGKYVSILDQASLEIVCEAKNQKLSTSSIVCKGISASKGIILNTDGNVRIETTKGTDNTMKNISTYGIWSGGDDTITKVSRLTIKYDSGQAPIYPQNMFHNVASNYAINVNKSNGTVTYKYGKPYWVTVTSGTCDATGTSTGEYLVGDKVTVWPDTAPSGLEFKEWTSNDVDLGFAKIMSLSFTMPAKNVAIRAEYKPITYIVSFDANGHGKAPKTQIVDIGKTATKPTNPEADGWTFCGWYEDSDCTKYFDFSTAITKNIKLYAAWTQGKTYTVTFDTQGHGTAPDDQIVKEGGKAARPATDPSEEGWIFCGWYENPLCTIEFDFDSKVINKDTTVYAYWKMNTYIDSEDVTLDEIPDLAYTGQAQKPVVKIYQNGALLKAGTDYTLTYVNNKNANATKTDGSRMMKVGDGIFGSMSDEGFNPDLPYVIIKGKGNYQNEVYVNFNILPPVIGVGSAKEAEGVVLKFTDHTEANGKLFKPLTSIKYGKITMKAGVDYEVKVEEAGVPGTNLLNAKGQMEAVEGTYLMTIKGIGNFDGEIVKTISVAAKTQLLKNAKIKLNIKSKEFDYLDLESDNTALADSDYTVTIADGKTTKVLVKDTDFTVTYRNNDKVGTATLVLTGKGSYVGSRTITFKITGTALSGKNVDISNVSDQTYIGKAVEQDAKLVLTKADGTKVNLVSGKDYTVTYQNNLKKGTATMTFKGNADAGYTGSVKKTFKINAANLSDDMVALIGDVPYAKTGATADAKVVLTYNGIKLIKGKDYTLKYTDNKDLGEATVTITGKGNFTGTLTKTFTVVKQDIAETTVTVKPLAYKPTEGYAYKLSVTVKDGKSTLKNGVDYTVEFTSPSKADLDLWLAGDNTKAPKAVIKAPAESCYKGSVEVPVSIYNVKLSGSNTYVKIDDSTNIYNGAQQLPKRAVYFSTDSAVIKELNAAEKAGTVDTVIAEKLAAGKIKVLKVGTDYTVSGVNNIFAGPNKGTVKISGTGMYSGSVSKKFTIQKKDIWWK